MASAIQFLDFRDLFINQIAGDVTIFIFLLLLMIAMASARFRLPTIATLGIFVVSLSLLLVSSSFNACSVAAFRSVKSLDFMIDGVMNR